MKKTISILLALVLALSFAACGKESGEWTREGYFEDEAGDFLSITYMDDVDEPGWYVGFMNGEDVMEDSYGGMLPVKGNSLKGKLPSAGSGGDLSVTITEEGEGGVLLKTKDGTEYHLTPMDLPEARFRVTLDTEGMGGVAYAEGTNTPEYDKNEPYQWAAFGVFDDNVTYTILAYEYLDDYHFVKWMKDGEDFTTEAQFTVDIDADVEFVAVFN